jgi:hypothetical protein
MVTVISRKTVSEPGLAPGLLAEGSLWYVLHRRPLGSSKTPSCSQSNGVTNKTRFLETLSWGNPHLSVRISQLNDSETWSVGGLGLGVAVCDEVLISAWSLTVDHSLVS